MTTVANKDRHEGYGQSHDEIVPETVQDPNSSILPAFSNFSQ